MHPWLLTALVLSLLLVVAGTLGVFILRQVMVRELPPALRAEVERFLTEPVTIPPEWTVVRDYAPAVLAAENELKTIHQVDGTSISYWNYEARAPLDHLQRSGTVTEEGWTSLTEFVRSGARLLEETSASVALAGYEAGAGPPGLGPVFYADRSAADLSCAAAHLCAKRGEWERAFEFALLPVRRAVRRPAAAVIVHDWSGWGLRAAARSLSALAWDCCDPALLRKALAELNGQRDRAIHHVLAEPELLNAVSTLQALARAGYPVDVASGRPAAWYFDQMIASYEKFPRWMAAKLPVGDPLRVEYEKITSYAQWCGFDHPEWMQWLAGRPVRVLLPEHYCIMYGSSWWYLMERSERTAAALYDLERILLARRILQLEGRPDVSSVADLVPEFLAKAPMDPFSDAPFPRDSKGGSFYSVGPDKKDDGLRVVYDTTRRGGNPGDIVLPEPDTLPAGEPRGRM